jgi:NhaA family Na+:H+ antiporter
MSVHEPRSQPGLHEPAALPQAPIERWMRPFVRFLHVESASGIVLLVCTVIALVLANSPWAAGFQQLWQTPLTVAVGAFELSKPLLLWINDGLMAVFFFVVGLEIKRELVAGELRDAKKAALPIMAALGGMVAPAAIYFSLQHGQPGEPGWGIPMATDIAFVVGFLALLGPRVPLGLKILLLALAIADDIGAVLVIALFYSTDIAPGFLGLALLGFGLIVLFNRIGVRRVSAYVVVGAFIWLAFLKSGIHPTVAGVLLGLLTPARAWVGDRALVTVLGGALHRLQAEKDGQVEDHHKPLLGEVESAAREAVSPLERLEIALHPWVAFGIMPLFALANAGVAIEPAALGDPVCLAAAAGLVIGKPLGIVLFSWLAVRLGLARLPTAVSWKVMIGAGCLAGIGFTMSLFIAGLALRGGLLDAGKLGTLIGSTVSALVGTFLLLRFLPRTTAAPSANVGRVAAVVGRPTGPSS